MTNSIIQHAPLKTAKITKKLKVFLGLAFVNCPDMIHWNRSHKRGLKMKYDDTYRAVRAIVNIVATTQGGTNLDKIRAAKRVQQIASYLAWDAAFAAMHEPAERVKSEDVAKALGVGRSTLYRGMDAMFENGDDD